MKKLTLLLFLMTVTAVGYSQKSPKQETKGTVAGVNVEVHYHAPSVKGRVIWGGLEQYGKVWRAGANQNTTVAFDKDVKVAGQDLPAGKYGFFIIPNKEGDWVVIFSKKNDAWGAYSYKESEDALRVNITPEMVEKNQEMLKYSVGENMLIFAWEKVELSIPVAAQ